ncbi:hypothetical protein BZM27_53835 [Paraburkholderia steynii]|uniref:Autotransporter domain-containing protein n=1 Tax=Paraburkholderia steynii TaxID=1245441 RepID=A0A4R0X5P9_9BURK|nr:hypothetical protein BZM27_53835 [Paraburkholderia steynii]
MWNWRRRPERRLRRMPVSDLWHDWGGNATAVYSALDTVPVQSSGSRLALGGGVTVALNNRLDLYLSGTYQFAVGSTDGGKRNGITGRAGVRYVW